MRVTGSHAYTRPAPVPKMPSGLEQIIEGLTKEVLRNNPNNVYEFCANHMQNLLEIRDGPVIKRRLTLEEKILKAQEKVRQRTKERCQLYDQTVQIGTAKVNPNETQTDFKSVMGLNKVNENDKPNASEDFNENSDGKALTNQKHCESPNHTNNYDIQSSSINDNSTEKLVVKDILEKIPKTTEKQFSTVLKDDDCKEINHEHNSVPDSLNDQKQVPNIYAVESNKSEEGINASDTLFNTNFEKEESKASESNDIQESNDLDKISFLNTDKISVIKNLLVGIENNDNALDEVKIINNVVESTPHTTDTPHDDQDSKSIKEDFIDDFKVPCKIDIGNEEIISRDSKSDNELLVKKPNIDDDSVLNKAVTVDNIAQPVNSVSVRSTELAHDENQCEKSNFSESIIHDKQENIELSEKNAIKGVDDNETAIQDINESDKMNLETAAITIQKVFRNFLFKSRASTYEEDINDESSTLDESNDAKHDNEYSLVSNLNKERRPFGNMRMDTVLQTVNEEKSLSLSTDDSSTLSSAATIIQAHVRGFLVRNKLSSLKNSTNSAGQLSPPAEIDVDQHKSKTPLNIHIVPEADPFLSRDESMMVSMDLSLDGSPPTSVNLHPLGYDKSERRKLTREDAVQSFSPPSNASGKLSEDVESVKENLKLDDANTSVDNKATDLDKDCIETGVAEITMHENITDLDFEPNNDKESISSMNTVVNNEKRRDSLTASSDETDVVTPFSTPASTPTLSHTGEFHDAVLPTKVSRGDTSVVREFKSVLVYFLLWNSV